MPSSRQGLAVALVAAMFITIVASFLVRDQRPSAALGADSYDGRVTRTDGVEGLFSSQANARIRAQVWDIEFIGNTAFVAGAFTDVVSAHGDWKRHDQPFLAAFDGSTGRWLPKFAPKLDRPVWALDQTADGRLLAGGEFTEVNGVSREGLVVLDPLTGATDPQLSFSVRRPWSSQLAVVRDLAVHGDDLYVVGNFTRAEGGGTSLNVGKAARFDLDTGTPDAAWRPQLATRSGWAVAISPDGARAHIGGEFSSVNGARRTALYATVNTTDGQLTHRHRHGVYNRRDKNWPFGGIVYDVAVSDDNVVWLAEAEHAWERRDSHTGRLRQLTRKALGSWFNDTQVVEVLGELTIVGCHCYNHHGYADHLVNTSTGAVVGALTRSVASGDGVWAAALAPDQCIWLGGDLRTSTRVIGREGRTAWVGRFGRFCPSGGPQPIPGQPDPGSALISSGDPWRVWTGASWPEEWQAVGFDDGKWPLHNTELGYGDGNETSPISSDHNPNAVIARTTFETAVGADAVTHLNLDVVADDGATIWLNGHQVATVRMPEGPIDQHTLASVSIWGAAEHTPVAVRITAEHLREGSNTVAVTIHQGWRKSADLSFDLTLTAETSP